MERREKRQLVIAYIAMGSNLGQREALIGAAARAIGAIDDLCLHGISSIVEFDAIGGPADSPPYMNAVAQAATYVAPDELMEKLLAIEQKLGRVRGERWAPRTIDLDLILYGDLVMKTDRLTIPHPRMHERRFVLAPLVEIAPRVVHPIFKRSVQTLLKELGPH